MKRFLTVFISLIAVFLIIFVYQQHKSPKYIITQNWTPVFGASDIQHILSIPGYDANNTPQYWREGETEAKWNPEQGIQFIAQPNTVFKIKNKLPNNIFQVVCISCHYEEKYDLHIAPQTFTLSKKQPPINTKKQPTKKEILAKLTKLSTQNIPYGWGGNAPYNQSLNIDKKLGNITNYGLDCSGLLQLATNGLTPRNTSQIINFGAPVDIQNKTAEEISQILKPLDIIVWKGHMMIVIEDNTIIESRYAAQDSEKKSGVQIRGLLEVLTETMENKIPVNNYDDIPEGKKGFVIRRPNFK